jgi:Uma2 family endonuclease
VASLNSYLGDAALVFSPGVIQVEPRHQLEPDLLVIPKTALPVRFSLDAKWSNLRDWWLAVEISGAGSEVYDRDFKGPAYLALGVLEYWRLDLREGSLFVSRSGEPGERKHTGTVTWLPPGRSEPLVIVVPDLFR